jgi:hypothetical protein
LFFPFFWNFNLAALYYVQKAVSVNCAVSLYTAVDSPEEDEDMKKRINARGFGICAVLVILAASYRPFFPVDLAFSPLLQVTPLRSSYATAGQFNPETDISVHRQETTGGMKDLSFANGEFTVLLTPPSGQRSVCRNPFREGSYNLYL